MRRWLLSFLIAASLVVSGVASAAQVQEDADIIIYGGTCAAVTAAVQADRMEPVFMILGQSAATAASFAIDAGCPVQKVNYRNLRDRLLADGQVLSR